MKFVCRHQHLLAVLAVLALANWLTAPASADYTQLFNGPTPTSGNQGINSLDGVAGDWSAYHYDALEGTAVDVAGGVAAAPNPRVGVAGVDGVDLPDAPSRGYLFAAIGAGADLSDSFSAFGEISTVAAESFSWYHASNAGINTQLLVRSGGAWYLSAARWDSTDVTGPGTAAGLQDEPLAGDNLISFSFDGTAANWFSFDPTTNATPIGGVAGANLSNEITGLGFYLSGDFSGSNTARLDAITVVGANIGPPPPAPVISDVDLGDGGVVNSITIRGQVVMQTELTNVTLTGYTDPDNAKMVLADGGAFPDVNSDVIADFSIDTGLADYGSLQATFNTALANTAGEDIVIVDLGGVNDSFEVTINGTTLLVPAGSQAYATEPLAVDRYASSSAGPINSVAELDALGLNFTPDNLEISTNRNFILLELDDFGVAAGQTISSISVSNIDVNGIPAFDTVAVFGLPAVPTAGLAGDYNGDGVVDAGDYTVWRDNLGGDAAEAFAAASRDAANSGPISQADYLSWNSSFGNPGVSLANASAAPVPEPTAWMIFGLVMSGIGLRRRRSAERAGSSA